MGYDCNLFTDYNIIVRTYFFFYIRINSNNLHVYIEINIYYNKKSIIIDLNNETNVL